MYVFFIQEYSCGVSFNSTVMTIRASREPPNLCLNVRLYRITLHVYPFKVRAATPPRCTVKNETKLP